MRSVFVLLLATLPALCGTYHVQKTGDDNSTSGPFLTINKAAQVAQPGDEVIVHAGEYREWVKPARGGTSESARIVYRAAPGEVVEIKGSERVTTWINQGGSVWKADIADNTFSNTTYNPYTSTIAGRYTAEYIQGGAWCHLGEVFLDGVRFDERQTQGEVTNTQRTWYTSHSGSTTTIYANFGSANPNTQLAEINVRESVFGNPSTTTGINYITVDGFTMMQSAEEWSPTYLGITSHAVIFDAGTHWIVENCTVKYGKMRGICIDGPNVDAYHIVRNNVVSLCGVAGIAGQYAHKSIISGNWIQDIGGRTYWGVEHGGIKIHQSNNITISGNIIYRVTAQNWGMGIWLDYAAQGNRITGNVIIRTSQEWLRPENAKGVNLFDNNIGLDCGEAMLEDGSVMAHNFSYNSGARLDQSWPGTGQTGTGENGRYYNNAIIGNSYRFVYPDKGHMADYNSFMSGAAKTQFDQHSVTDNTSPGVSYSVDENARRVTLNITLGTASTNLACPVLSSSTFGILNDNNKMANPDGSDLTIDRDYFQLCRGTAPRVGPFQMAQSGTNTFVLRPNSDFNWRGQCSAANPRFTSVTVSPVEANVKPGQTRQFTASALDQYGAALATQPSSFAWSVSGGGAINALGLFTAGSTEGGPFTVTARAIVGSETKDGAAQVTVTSSSTVVAVNAGGPAAGTFSADQFFSGGADYIGTAGVSTTGVTNAAPAEVYQSERYGSFAYTMAGLTPGGHYTVRLHFAEIYHSSAGARVFNVTVNGSAVLSNFDIFAVAGGKDKALVRDVAATANGSGQIVINFVTITDQAKVSGIEILEGGATVVPFLWSSKGADAEGLRCMLSGRKTMQLSISRHGDHEIRVINGSGAIIQRFCGTGPATYGMNAAPLGAGVYFIEARAGQRAIGHQAIVVW